MLGIMLNALINIFVCFSIFSSILFSVLICFFSIFMNLNCYFVMTRLEGKLGRLLDIKNFCVFVFFSYSAAGYRDVVSGVTLPIEPIIDN